MCRDFSIRTVFKAGPTLRGILTKVKDPLQTTKQSNVVYEVPCTCGKVYIGETKRRLETRLKEHKDASTRCLTDTFVIAERKLNSSVTRLPSRGACQDKTKQAQRNTDHTQRTEKLKSQNKNPG